MERADDSLAEPMTVRDVVFWGASGHAKVLHEAIAHRGWNLVAVCDRDPALESPFRGVPLHHGAESFQRWLKSTQAERDRPLGFLIAIGGARGQDRLALHDYLCSLGLEPLVLRHPTAFVAPDVRLGDGSQVLAQATISVDVQVGRQCIINHRASVDHECSIADGVHICPGATLAGLVRVDHCAMIGAGAVVLPRRVIGASAIVGAGAVVTRDVPSGVVVAGNPARILRNADRDC